jgi:hypothetical protein
VYFRRVGEHNLIIGGGRVFIFVGTVHVRHEVTQDIQSSLAFVVSADNRPWCMRMVRVRKHVITSLAVVVPMFERDGVNRTALPLFEWIGASCFQPARLFVTADIELVLEQLNARVDQKPFKNPYFTQERFVLSVRTEPHHAFNAGAVVPTAIEQHHFLRHGQIGDVALKVPRAAVPIRRLAQRDHACFARTQMLRHPLDNAVFTGGVPSFEDD